MFINLNVETVNNILVSLSGQGLRKVKKAARERKAVASKSTTRKPPQVRNHM